MSPLIGPFLVSVSLGASPPASAPAPSTPIETGHKASWAGVGLSAVGSTLVVAGGFGFYDDPLEAIDRYQGGRDPQKVEPGVAIASGVIVGGGMGLSAVGRPVLSFSSALTARAYKAQGGAVTPTLGWISVGAWAAGAGSYFAAQATDSSALDWTWVGLRAASFGTGLAQVLQTHKALHGSRSATHQRRTPPPVQLVLSPSGGALVGRF